jgi:hypothetical protein
VADVSAALCQCLRDLLGCGSHEVWDVDGLICSRRVLRQSVGARRGYGALTTIYFAGLRRESVEEIGEEHVPPRVDNRSASHLQGTQNGRKISSHV